MKIIKKLYSWKTLLLLTGFFCSCQTEKKPSPENSSASISTDLVDSLLETPPDSPELSPVSTINHYPWLEEQGSRERLIGRIPAPEGYKRVKLEEGSFGDWLRYLPLKERGSPVLLFNGERKGRQDVHAAVVEIDIGKKDLQQCADAVMRLRAEYWYSKKEYQKIHFNFTSGDLVSFDDWRRGRRPRVLGNHVSFSSPSGNPDNSYSNFKSYINRIFQYAGTSSLSKELQSVQISQMQIGDVFIRGGFPGHAVIVLDMAEKESGEKVFLLAQSYMPAQNIHILRNPNDTELSPWYRVPNSGDLHTPEWTFSLNQLMRFSAE